MLDNFIIVPILAYESQVIHQNHLQIINNQLIKAIGNNFTFFYH